MKTYTDHQRERYIGRIVSALPRFSNEYLEGLGTALMEQLDGRGKTEPANAPHLRLVTGQSRGGKRHADRSASAAG
ncbi:hypothetical protein B7486_12930 [cyanobacterium TDX16]|nr:hypothetical protein B7486_12930 [cyanobacterium TDX16]